MFAEVAPGGTHTSPGLPPSSLGPGPSRVVLASLTGGGSVAAIPGAVGAAAASIPRRRSRPLARFPGTLACVPNLPRRAVGFLYERRLSSVSHRKGRHGRERWGEPPRAGFPRTLDVSPFLVSRKKVAGVCTRCGPRVSAAARWSLWCFGSLRLLVRRLLARPVSGRSVQTALPALRLFSGSCLAVVGPRHGRAG